MTRRSTLICALFAVAVLLQGCPPPGGNNGNNGTNDAGNDVDDADFELEQGKLVDEQFESFSAEPELEIVSGFQGGWHIEPGLKITGLDREEFVVVGGYWIVDVDTGEFLQRPSNPDEDPNGPTTFRVDQSVFEEQDGGLVRKYPRVILDVDSADVATDEVVELRVSIQLENGGTAWNSREITLVDEVDELGP